MQIRIHLQSEFRGSLDFRTYCLGWLIDNRYVTVQAKETPYFFGKWNTFLLKWIGSISGIVVCAI